MLAQQELFSLIHVVSIFFPALVIIFTFTGFIQAYVATLMGDDTPGEYGFLSLNPVVHVDVVGLAVTMIFIVAVGYLFGDLPRGTVLLFLVAFGVHWLHPVPINHYNFKNFRIGGILTSLSRIFAEILLASIAILLCKFLPLNSMPVYAAKTALYMIHDIIHIALWFGVINLIPIPPFDGGKVLYYVLPESQRYIVEYLEYYSLFILLGLVCLPVISDYFFGSMNFIATLIEINLFALIM